jgi:tetratricopeptide (TPR) repeat protein
MVKLTRALFGLLLVSAPVFGQEAHDHGVPEKLGSVSFPISCDPSVQQSFNRAVALLHSFAYAPADQAFRKVAQSDPRCAMAYWGLAMVHFHPVWTPALPPEAFAQAQKDALQAVRLGAKTERERGFIHAAGVLFQAKEGLTSDDRTRAYEQAMAQVARDHATDIESQVFYAVALLSNASPTDPMHARQKQAIGILEPLFRAHPDHPGLAHYLIHASDSVELAQQGLPAARAYAQIAPSAPHALHMPSHIFTRLGLWDDSIQSNLASRQSAHAQGDAMGELHAMDYLVYAYLQQGRDAEAAQVIDEAKAMSSLDMTNFAIAYASVVMPIRMAVERSRWNDAANIAPPATAPPAVVAIAVWSKGIGLARSGHPDEAREQARRLRQIEKQLRDANDDYWAVQTAVLIDEVMAWASEAAGRPADAETLLRAAADREDTIEKRPVTPGPVIPAREQLGNLLLQNGKQAPASEAFAAALIQAPGRRGALLGEAKAGGAH